MKWNKKNLDQNKENESEIFDKELKELVASNLCRCTGYQNIIKAIRSVIDGEKE